MTRSGYGEWEGGNKLILNVKNQVFIANSRKPETERGCPQVQPWEACLQAQPPGASVAYAASASRAPLEKASALLVLGGWGRRGKVL